MILLSLFLLAHSAAASAGPARTLDCNYTFMSVPFTEVQLGLSEAGTDEFVTVITQGRGHRESFTPEATAADMLLHGWISKESAENQIEMIVYKEPKKQGQSVLINHKMPMGKEVWGKCALK